VPFCPVKTPVETADKDAEAGRVTFDGAVTVLVAVRADAPLLMTLAVAVSSDSLESPAVVTAGLKFCITSVINGIKFI
jgi:hypothetical protein